MVDVDEVGVGWCVIGVEEIGKDIEELGGRYGEGGEGEDEGEVVDEVVLGEEVEGRGGLGVIVGCKVLGVVG